MSRRSVAAAFLSLCLVTGATSCGIPLDGAPTKVSPNAVPFGLLAPSAPTSTTEATIPSPVEVTVQIYLIGPQGHLIAVQRDIAFPAALPSILTALVDGPTAAEAAGGLQSAVPTQTAVLSATVAAGAATVDLSGTFGQLVGQIEIDAVAQVVYTVTELPGITSVSFQLSGQPVSVPTATGADVPAAGRAQFAPLAPT